MTHHTTNCASQRVRTSQPVDQLPCDCANLGLHVDMLDVDFICFVANHTADTSTQASMIRHLRLLDLADRLALEIVDVGRLRGCKHLRR